MLDGMAWCNSIQPQSQRSHSYYWCSLDLHLTLTNTRGLLPLHDLFYYHFPHTDLGSIFFFQLAMKAVPYRKDFITTLGKGQADEETVLKDMQHCTSLLGANWDVIEDFYQKTGQDSDQKV